MNVRYYTGNIEPANDVIFVFGSNPEGRHGSGSAKCAIDKFGAIYGQGEGLQGQCYALPTKDLRVKENHALRSISPEQIILNIKKMYECAEENPDKKFMIAYRNTDEVTLNGYNGYEMMGMFLKAGTIPDNVYVSEEWHSTGLFGPHPSQGDLFRAISSGKTTKTVEDLKNKIARLRNAIAREEDTFVATCLEKELRALKSELEDYEA